MTTDQASVSPWPTTIRVGLIGGLIMVAFSLISNMTELSIPTSIGGGILLFVVSLGLTVAIGIWAVRQHREQDLGGYITLGRGFLVGAVAMFIASLINGLFSAVYVSMIDPGFADLAVAKTGELMERMGVAASDIEEQLEATRERLTPSGMIRSSLIGGVIISAILGIIVAAIFKKERPITEDLLDE